MLGEDIIRGSWIYALAAHEYYWGDGTKHILEDKEYDALTNILKINWLDIPKELKEVFGTPKELGQGATQIKLTESQLKIARFYYSQYVFEKEPLATHVPKTH